MDTPEEKIILAVPRHLTDKRFDAALCSLLQEKFPKNKALSRGFATRLIRSGKALLNGTAAKPSVPVNLHDRIGISPEALAAGERNLYPNGTLRPKILFEDEHVLVINKSGSLQTHPAGRRTHDTLANWLIAKHPELEAVGENPLRPGIVHRLDRETSGALVIAKTNESFRELKKLFQDRSIRKTYVALVYGHLPSLSGVIDRPLTRRSGELKRRIAQETGSESGNVRPAVTEYRVIARYRDFDLVLLTPRTGRTHQIRVHLASLGHPVVGDKLYAFKSMRQGKALFPSRHLLHAWRLKWKLFGQEYAFQAPLPQDFTEAIRSIDETRETSYDDEALKSLLPE